MRCNHQNYYQNMFLETYNSIYLDKLTRNQLFDLKSLVEIQNPVLFKLIENYQNSNSSTPYINTKYIEGPSELYVYKLVDKNRPDIIRYIYIYLEKIMLIVRVNANFFRIQNQLVK